MNIGKLWFATLLALGALPATALAQPVVSANVVVTADDSYDTTAPGVPVESVDVFYDQLAPYGVWVDEPTIGHVFIPSEDAFVPYTNGHWENTSVGFVWVANEPFAAQTSHYGRWAYSSPYARWVWLPDTQWGPSWVSWQQSGDDFGWAPLAPDVIISTGYAPPIDSWHYCGAAHVLDVNIGRYYEPRERVVEIHRAARPMQNYATVSNVKVVVGPSSATLRTYHVTPTRVKIDVKVAGRVSSTSEARAQVVHAQANKPAREAENQKRIQANTHIAAVVAKQPAAKTEMKTEPKTEPKPAQHVAPKPEMKQEPKPAQHVEPKPAPAQHVAPKPEMKQEPKPVQHAEPKPQPAQHVAPKPEMKQEPKAEPKPEAKPEPAAVQHEAPKAEPKAEPKPAQPAQHAEPKKPEPEKHH